MMKTEREQLRALLAEILATDPCEVDCEEFLARVAAYLERLDSDAPLPEELEPVVQHLKVCAPCAEEFEALVDLYRK